MKRTNVPLALIVTTLALVGGVTQAFAAVTVTFYGPGAQSPMTTPSTPTGIHIGDLLDLGRFDSIDKNQTGSSVFGFDTSVNLVFTQGSDLNPDAGDFQATFFNRDLNVSSGGAIVDGVTKNYANINLNGVSFKYEAVGEFVLDGQGTSYLNALAVSESGETLPISVGKAAIDAAGASASVPEPSKSLALLTLLGIAFMRCRVR